VNEVKTISEMVEAEETEIGTAMVELALKETEISMMISSKKNQIPLKRSLISQRINRITLMAMQSSDISKENTVTRTHSSRRLLSHSTERREQA
jgi:hypothetical protein